MSAATGELSTDPASSKRQQAAPRRAFARAGGRVSPVWAVAATCALIVGGLIAWQALVPRPFYTGSNSVGVRSVVANLQTRQTLCVRGLYLPAETGRVQLAVFAHRATFAAQVTVSSAGRRYFSRMVGAPGPTSLAFASAAIPKTPSAPAATPASVCIAPLDGPIALGGMIGLQSNQTPALLDGVPDANRVSVWFLPPAGVERSLLQSAGAIFDRASLFRPGFVGPWTYPVLLFFVLPLAWLISLCTLAGCLSERRSLLGFCRAHALALVVLVTFLNAASWALITPAFDAPDEPSHFAYAQYLAETGHAPDRTQTARQPYSTDQTLALNAIDVYSQVSLPEATPPWLSVQQRAWERERRAGAHSDGDGGGYTVAASSHQPAYYGLMYPAYAVSAGDSPFAQLTAMRLLSALLGALVAACAYGIVRELLPGQRLAAATAGLLVGFQPMFGFISGAVNNDNGVNAAAALALYLLIRALRRRLTVPLALGLGLVAALVPAMKETGYEVYPALAIGALGLAWRNHRLRDLAGFVALAGSFVATRVIWLALQPSFYPTVGGHSEAGNGIDAAGAVTLAEHMPGRFLVYLWELVLPRLPFMGELFPSGWPFKQVYIVRGWGAFGWYTWVFPDWVYQAIVFAIGVGLLLAIAALVRELAAVRTRVFELLVIALYPVCVIVAVEAAYFAPSGGRTVFAEQGRYVFPAMAALGAIAAGATFGLGRRRQAPLAIAAVIAMLGLGYASQLLTLGSAFT